MTDPKKPSRPVTQTGLPDDPLGYDTSDFQRCAREMAAAAISGRNRDAVRDEIAKVERRITKDGL